MGALLQGILGIFSSGAGSAVGSTIANVAGIAALAPMAYWFLANKDGVAVSLTWGQLGFFGLLIFAIIKIVHYTKSPGG